MTLQLTWPLLLLPLPLLIYLYLPAVNEQSAALRVPFFATIRSLETQRKASARADWPRLIGLIILWVSLVIACCRPVIIGESIALPTSARDLLLAVDISGSMDERDMLIQKTPATRIQMVKHVLSGFVDRRAGDRIGLVLFADHAYLQAPLTFDTDTVKQLLLEAQLGFAGQKTAIGDAIGVSIKRLIERPAESRTLILLTDGANNSGSVTPLEAGQLAADQGVKIYTIGIGSERTTRAGIFGRSLRRNLSADLDEETLTLIAEQSGGRYFRATSPEQLEAIYAELDRLEPVEQNEQNFRPIKELFYWPLSLALAAMLALLLPNLRLSAQYPRQSKP